MEEQDLQHRLSELQSHLKTLEERVISMERRQSMQPDLPQTALLSGSFLTRAFAVLGHYIVASLIIAIPIYIIIFVVILMIGISFSQM
ncbi:MAG: hypothetical protein JXA28_01010 [Bacteroidetes bacterium]|nr:hypothetical protein [Bacteroidota bacterium]